jgi:hypothetical protein
MKTWKSKRTVCRSSRSGRFVRKRKCSLFKRQRVKVHLHPGTLFKL